MPLKNNKLHRINATATPAAMKGYARAGSVISAPVNAEERLLKVCASVSDKIIGLTVLRGIGQGVRTISIPK